MTNDDGASVRMVGNVRALDGRGVVRMEDRYKTDIDDLWSALTNPERLARWIADVHGALHVGGEFHARFTSGWDGPGRVDVCEPPRFLQLTLCPGQEDETVIEAHLVAQSDQLTRLVIEERGLPLDELAVHGAGWQAHVEDLSAYLAGHASIDWPNRWAELRPSYQALAEKLQVT
jgi:uncharacterized protein YndB with AHSA1/START domain